MGDGSPRDDVIVLQGIRKEFGSFVAVEHYRSRINSQYTANQYHTNNYECLM